MGQALCPETLTAQQTLLNGVTLVNVEQFAYMPLAWATALIRTGTAAIEFEISMLASAGATNAVLINLYGCHQGKAAGRETIAKEQLTIPASAAAGKKLFVVNWDRAGINDVGLGGFGTGIAVGVLMAGAIDTKTVSVKATPLKWGNPAGK